MSHEILGLCVPGWTVRGQVIEAAKVKLGTDVAASEFYNVTWPQAVLKTKQYLWVHYRILTHSSTKQHLRHEGVRNP